MMRARKAAISKGNGKARKAAFGNQLGQGKNRSKSAGFTFVAIVYDDHAAGFVCPDFLHVDAICFRAFGPTPRCGRCAPRRLKPTDAASEAGHVRRRLAVPASR